MLACRVREHNKTDQTIKKIGNKQRTDWSLLKITVRETMFCQSFSSPLQRVVPYILVQFQRSIFQDRIINTPHEFHVYLSPQTKRGCTSKVGVIIKVVVCRTLSCVVARIALATDCCCWSIRSACRRERGWMLSETSEKRAKNIDFERYSPVVLRILMNGEVDKIKLGTTIFPNWRHLSQNK